MSYSRISAGKRFLGSLLLFIAAAAPLLAQTSITSNDGGTGTPGNLYEAVNAINGTSNGGNVTLGITGSNSVTLQQDLHAFSQSVTFLGTTGTDQALGIFAQNESEGAVTFDQNLTLGDGVTFNLSNIASGGSGSSDSFVSAGGILSMGAGDSLAATAGSGAVTGITYGGSGTGSSGNMTAQTGSNAAVTAGNWTLGQDSAAGLSGGWGGSVSVVNSGPGTAVNGGVTAGSGGTASVETGSLAMGTGGEVGLSGGAGGGVSVLDTGADGVGATGGATAGSGGDASVSTGSLSLAAASAFAVSGGTGGSMGVVNTGALELGVIGSTAGGNGGDAEVSVGAFSMDAASACTVSGGTGGDASLVNTGAFGFAVAVANATAGNGGAAGVSADSVTLTDSTLAAVGGMGGDVSVNTSNTGDGISAGSAEGGTGGKAWASTGSMALSGSTLAIVGGAGGGVSVADTGSGYGIDGGNAVGGNGGAAGVSMGSMTLAGSAFNVSGGAGGSVKVSSSGGGTGVSGNARGGNGGNASVSVASIFLGGSSTFTAEGGAGGTGSTGGTAGSAFVTLGSLAGSGSVSLWGSTALLQVESGEFSGSIQGNGSLVVSGPGTFVLDGSDVSIAPATVAGGTLIVGGSSASQGFIAESVMVSSGSNLLGFGQVVGAVTNTGLVAPGNGAPGTLTVGDYTQAAGATLGIGVMAAQAAALNVRGAADLAGNLDLVPDGSFRLHDNETLTLLDASGVLGTFGTVTNGLGLGVTVIYNPASVVLDLSADAPSFQSLGTNSNQKNIGGLLDHLATGGGLPALVNYLSTLSDSALPGAYDQISPANLTPLYQMGFATAQADAGLVGGRISQLFGEMGLNSNDNAWNGHGPMFAGDMPAAEEASLSKGLEPRRWGVFVNGLGNFGTVTGDGNGPGYQYSTGGLAAGMDYRFGKDLVGGLLLGYSSSGTSQSSGSVNSTGGQVGLYAGWKQQSLHVNALVAGGVNNYTTQRQTLGGMASGNTQGSQFSGELNFSYDMKAGDIKIQPFASGQYTNVGINAFTETGSLAPLSFVAQNEDYLSSNLGATAQKKFDMGGWSLTPSVSAAWEHVYQGNLDSLSANFGSGSNFTVNGPALGADAAVLGLGANATLAKGMAAYVSYQGKVGLTNYAEQNLSLGANIGF